MIKGINHTIIEMNDTGSDYYERAILIIKPEYACVQRAVLEDEARRILREMDAPSAIRSGKRRIRESIKLTAAAVGGGIAAFAVTAAVMHIV